MTSRLLNKSYLFCWFQNQKLIQEGESAQVHLKNLSQVINVGLDPVPMIKAVSREKTAAWSSGKLVPCTSWQQLCNNKAFNLFLITSLLSHFLELFFQEYMVYRKHTYMRLDGSSKISERRDMVADFQSRWVHIDVMGAF